MQYYDQSSEPQLAPAYFSEVPVDPLGLAPKTGTITEEL